VKLQTYTVKAGDVLSEIAAKKRIAVDLKLLQCMNGIKDPDLISVGQVLQIPPEGYTCPQGWRRATPEP
jgi:LysM repeat protein